MLVHWWDVHLKAELERAQQTRKGGIISYTLLSLSVENYLLLQQGGKRTLESTRSNDLWVVTKNDYLNRFRDFFFGSPFLPLVTMTKHHAKKKGTVETQSNLSVVLVD